MLDVCLVAAPRTVTMPPAKTVAKWGQDESPRYSLNQQVLALRPLCVPRSRGPLGPRGHSVRSAPRSRGPSVPLALAAPLWPSRSRPLCVPRSRGPSVSLALAAPLCPRS
ncbi:hypothetical protein Baya_11615 [Bagarius yarrelli]|uniref:Uncharacterized protein n=1 Tax=Bagarius yarrelli TaxID=175774 RepID=A0A556V2E3_BAGYA|nr:hypothetical protein Baya_11615 [Bagarius yarrelli]